MTMTYTYYGRKKKTGEEKEDVFTTHQNSVYRNS